MVTFRKATWPEKPRSPALKSCAIIRSFSPRRPCATPAHTPRGGRWLLPNLDTGDSMKRLLVLTPLAIILSFGLTVSTGCGSGSRRKPLERAKRFFGGEWHSAQLSKRSDNLSLIYPVINGLNRVERWSALGSINKRLDAPVQRALGTLRDRLDVTRHRMTGYHESAIPSDLKNEAQRLEIEIAELEGCDERDN